MRNALAQQKNETNTTAIKNETIMRKPCNALAEQKNETNTTVIKNEMRVRKPCNVCEANAEAMKNNDRVSLSANDFEPCPRLVMSETRRFPSHPVCIFLFSLRFREVSG